jgi:quercetin dioxygenase-like cupin family protein
VTVTANWLTKDVDLTSAFGTIGTRTLARGDVLPADDSGMENAVVVLSGSMASRGVALGRGDGVYGRGELTATSDDACVLVINSRQPADSGPAVNWRYASPNRRNEGILADTGGFTDMGVRWLVTSETVGSSKLVVATSVFTPSGEHGAHRHPHADEFFLVIEGGGEHLSPQGPIGMEVGDLVLVPAGEWHGYRTAGGTATTSIYGYLGAGSLQQAGYELEG